MLPVINNEVLEPRQTVARSGHVKHVDSPFSVRCMGAGHHETNDM